MKRMYQWMMAAIITCGSMVLTACVHEGNPVPPEYGGNGIAMIVKCGYIDYFRQMEMAFRNDCQEKGLKAYYYSTSSETDYQQQLAAVEKLRKLKPNALSGIILVPSFGPNGESAEAAVAALAKERGIPVVIIDSPVSASSPLASCPYFGTDNTAAGKEMAEKVTADKVAVFAMTNSPGIERANAFKTLKPNAVIYEVGDKAVSEVQAVMDEYDDFVFFNGNDLVDALPMLKAAGKRVYTFDVYGEFLDELIAGNAFFKGIMAQNTFEMVHKAVKAVLTRSRWGKMVPTFYITADNLDDSKVEPFLEFYNKQNTAVIPNLAAKIRGKWIETEVDGQPALTNEKAVTTFLSATKALFSSSLPDFTEKQAKWSDRREYDVKISGNKVSLTGHPESDPNITLIEDFIISSVTATEIVCKHKHTTIRDGQGDVSVNERNVRLARTGIDYRQNVIGTWEGQIAGSHLGRWTLKADGTHEYSRQTSDGSWVKMDDVFAQYFVDGNLFCARWKNVGEGQVEHRDWWMIESIRNGVMKWTALRRGTDGSTYTETLQLTKVNP